MNGAMLSEQDTQQTNARMYGTCSTLWSTYFNAAIIIFRSLPTSLDILVSYCWWVNLASQLKARLAWDRLNPSESATLDPQWEPAAKSSWILISCCTGVASTLCCHCDMLVPPILLGKGAQKMAKFWSFDIHEISKKCFTDTMFKLRFEWWIVTHTS